MKNKYINHICFLLVFFTLAGFGQSAWAQTITASGKVLDRNQEPLIGANVKVLDTATGTITNPDGHFTLECPKGSILEVSFIGYVSQKVAAGQDLTIVLEEDAITLQETVIVGIGYGTMRKSDLTGAIASVSQKDMKQGIKIGRAHV